MEMSGRVTNRNGSFGLEDYYWQWQAKLVGSKETSQLTEFSIKSFRVFLPKKKSLQPATILFELRSLYDYPHRAIFISLCPNYTLDS